MNKFCGWKTLGNMIFDAFSLQTTRGLNTKRHFSISTNTKSFSYVLKKFEDINVYDVVACQTERTLKRVVGKHINEVVHYSKEDKLSKFRMVSRYFDAEDISTEIDLPTRNMLEGRISGAMQVMERTDLKKIGCDEITFWPTYLVLDWNSVDKKRERIFGERARFFQRFCFELQVTDIVRTFQDGKYYEVMEFVKSKATEYGGSTYNSSYFKVVEIFPSDCGFSQGDTVYKLYVGDWAMEKIVYYAVLNDEQVNLQSAKNKKSDVDAMTLPKARTTTT